MDEKVILDACCGGRTFWFNKHHPNAVYVDKREMEKRTIWTSKDGTMTREFEVHPDILADFTKLPFDDETFWHVVFDPPHLTRAGEGSWLATKYGRLDGDWRETLRKGFWECMRVLKPHGTLVFKWNETDIPVREILKIFGGGGTPVRSKNKQKRHDGLACVHEAAGGRGMTGGNPPGWERGAR